VKKVQHFLALFCLLLSTYSPTAAQKPVTPEKVSNWPSFRGVHASGVANGYPSPTSWNVEENKNVLWKTPIPGLGHSSPIVWNDRVFITTAVSGKEKVELKVGLYGEIDPVDDDTVHQWKVYCLNKKTGKILWEKTAHKGIPKVKRHTKGTQANSTMATDGKSVVAFFGSEGLYCYDLQGNLRWKKDLGVLDSGFFQVPEAQWGFASSPVLYDNKVLVQCDIQKGSFIAAFDLRDGREIWRTPRGDVPTWSTPTVFRGSGSGRAQVVVNGWKHIGGYDVATGKELWRLTGGGDIPVPTPVVGHGLIFITNAHGRMSPIYAIRADASGDISLTGDATASRHIAWSQTRGGAYMQTPLVYGDYLYNCRDNGVLSCYQATTGKRVYEERLGTGRTGFTASSVAADGKLYFTSEEGEIFVVKAGPVFQVLSVNTMGEICMATPALSQGALFFRTQGHLVAIAEAKKP
jgi:outer membrane protein assembly factor BamB